MIFNAKSEPAVSPVIGTILLVAIAVVLVAIILVVVMGFSGDTNEKKVGLNAKSESGANATLILYGGASIDELVRLEMIDQDSPTGEYVKLWDINENGSAFVGVPYPGDVARPLESMAVYDTRINVRGTFSDGTEVILLVQPMTFYDVKQSSNNLVTPIVNTPTVSAIMYTTANIDVTFENMSSVPDEYRIYYQSMDDETSPEEVEIVSGPDTFSGKFAAKLENLEEGTDYSVWGNVITGTDGTINSSTKAIFTTNGWKVYNFTAASPSSSSINVQFSYKNSPSATMTGRVYYQLADGGTEQFMGLGGKGNQNGGYYSGTITGLDEGTEYYVWGSVITPLGTKNTSKILVTTKGWRLYDFTATSPSSSSIDVQFKFENSPSATMTGRVYYQLADGGTEQFMGLGGKGNQNGGYYPGTITGLDEGTKYYVWGSMITPLGTRNTSKILVTTREWRLYDFTATSPSSSSITVQFSFENSPSATMTGRVYYQLADGGTEQFMGLGGKGNQNGGYYPGTITGLDKGTEYYVWGSMITPLGTKNTSKIPVTTRS